MKDSFFKNFIVNIRAFFMVNIRRRLNENSAKIDRLEGIVNSLDYTMTEKFHYLHLLDYYGQHTDEAVPFKKELDYLRRVGSYCIFPYESMKEPQSVVSGFDDNAKLPYVIHKNRKLFFKSSYSEEEALELYRNYIQTEKLLGDGEEEAPHRYQSPRVCVFEGDVLFDIGAAEGLFALDQIDKTSRVIIVESDPQWIEPLKHTFAPFGEKVSIIQKFVSATDSETTVSLGSLLSDVSFASAFVKMDIEGYEMPSIVSAENVLRQKNVKLSVASYHKQRDAEELEAIFDRMGFYSEFSSGYMLFHSYDMPAPPYFRHGIIRTKSPE